MRSLRLAFTVGVVLVQLFMLPAAQLLHIGCHHSDHPEGSETQASAESHAHHGHSHCCHHEHSHSAPESDSGEPAHQSQSPHDSHSCPICQVVLAARICDVEGVQVPLSDLVVAWSGFHIPEVCSAPGYVLPSRGPPA